MCDTRPEEKQEVAGCKNGLFLLYESTCNVDNDGAFLRHLKNCVPRRLFIERGEWVRALLQYYCSTVPSTRDHRHPVNDIWPHTYHLRIKCGDDDRSKKSLESKIDFESFIHRRAITNSSVVAAEGISLSRKHCFQFQTHWDIYFFIRVCWGGTTTFYLRWQSRGGGQHRDRRDFSIFHLTIFPWTLLAL